MNKKSRTGHTLAEAAYFKVSYQPPSPWPIVAKGHTLSISTLNYVTHWCAIKAQKKIFRGRGMHIIWKARISLTLTHPCTLSYSYISSTFTSSFLSPSLTSSLRLSFTLLVSQVQLSLLPAPHNMLHGWCTQVDTHICSTPRIPQREKFRKHRARLQRYS